MPWFNTTVGLNTTSDDELENDFKNDENDDKPDAMGWCGIPFGTLYIIPCFCTNFPRPPLNTKDMPIKLDYCLCIVLKLIEIIEDFRNPS